MIRHNVMLGLKVPFFLSNNPDTKNDYYLYEIYSPGLDEELDPYFSLTKVTEKTRKGVLSGKDSDILSYVTGVSENIKPGFAASVVEEIFKRFDQREGQKNHNVEKWRVRDTFPWISVEPGNILQRQLIVGLRDKLRWKHYKLGPGNMIDILWDKNHYVMVPIEGSEDTVYLGTPSVMYETTDLDQTNPLPVPENVKEALPKNKWSGPNKASSLNWVIKRFEIESLTR